MRVSPDVLAILDRCTIDGNRLLLPGQLDRKDYVAVNKVIEAAGGKWSKREKAHLFAADTADVVDSIALTGEIVSAKQALGFFPTPPEVIARLIALAELTPGVSVLEPSAGTGAIVEPVAAIVRLVIACEIDPGRANSIRGLGLQNVRIAQADFLESPPNSRYDRVVMNPPFARQQDIDHVTHALGFLKADGLLVSVMSVSVTYRESRKAEAFRKLVADRGGWFEELPEDAFKASGTGVHTVIVVIPAGGAA